ncbi:MAG: hypothetical protein FWC53_00805 [Firmicutes bacterium]|nr:hypothetical protein [Bacillota bacterium]
MSNTKKSNAGHTQEHKITNIKREDKEESLRKLFSLREILIAVFAGGISLSLDKFLGLIKFPYWLPNWVVYTVILVISVYGIWEGNIKIAETKSRLDKEAEKKNTEERKDIVQIGAKEILEEIKVDEIAETEVKVALQEIQTEEITKTEFIEILKETKKEESEDGK